MGPSDQPDATAPASRVIAIPDRHQNRPDYPALSLRTLRLYQIADGFSEKLIYFAVAFSPWAFGTTTLSWSVWTMNIAGYLLGALLITKLAIRWLTDYQPPRWGHVPMGPALTADGKIRNPATRLTTALAMLTILILFFCLVSAVNARSTYHPEQFSFEYHKSVSWLPHSFDRASTWRIFWNYLALAFLFWAMRDWLLGKTASEERAARSKSAHVGQVSLLPARVRRLLWVLCINGALLGIEAIAQRLSGTAKLLWLKETHINAAAEFQFGPYAYRSNAAQYFNLLWPVCLGFWWTLQRSAQLEVFRNAGKKLWAHHLLLLCILIMAACPIISTSRAGALIAMANLLIAASILLLALRRAHGATKFGVFIFFTIVLGTGFYFGWEKLGERMQDFGGGLQGREQLYDAARPMAKDCPLFGTGPGTFEQLFQLYRTSPDEYWPAQLHNDWLETRITFGWLGSAMIALAFALVLARWFAPGGIHGGGRVVALFWLALAGCLAHARFDFPFQIYSILFLFLTICAILVNFSRLPKTS